MFEIEAIRALIMALIAGMSTLVGAVIVIFVKKDSKKVVAISLGFAGGVMLSVSFTDLLPYSMEALEEFSGERLGILFSVIFLIIGVLMAAGLDRFVPHEHHEEEGRKHENLFRLGFVSMLAIALHNFPEGIATFMAAYDNERLGLKIALAISMHNIPEGIAVALPIYYATSSKLKAFKYTFITGIAEPLGAIIAFLLLRPFMNAFALGAIFALITGVMIYITIEELLPSSRQYGHNKQALIATFIGICIMPLAGMI